MWRSFEDVSRRLTDWPDCSTRCHFALEIDENMAEDHGKRLKNASNRWFWGRESSEHARMDRLRPVPDLFRAANVSLEGVEEDLGGLFRVFAWCRAFFFASFSCLKHLETTLSRVYHRYFLALKPCQTPRSNLWAATWMPRKECTSMRRTADLEELLALLERQEASELARPTALRSELLRCFGARSCGALRLQLEDASAVAKGFGAREPLLLRWSELLLMYLMAVRRGFVT